MFFLFVLLFNYSFYFSNPLGMGYGPLRRHPDPASSWTALASKIASNPPFIFGKNASPDRPLLRCSVSRPASHTNSMIPEKRAVEILPIRLCAPVSAVPVPVLPLSSAVTKFLRISSGPQYFVVERDRKQRSGLPISMLFCKG